MPPTSEQLPLLGIYYAVTTCIVSLSTAMTVFTLNINNKGHRGLEVPQLARKIFLNYIARILKIKTHSNNHLIKTNIFKENLNSLSFDDFNKANDNFERDTENPINLNYESK
jgi:hypothetical protein